MLSWYQVLAAKLHLSTWLNTRFGTRPTSGPGTGGGSGAAGSGDEAKGSGVPGKSAGTTHEVGDVYQLWVLRQLALLLAPALRAVLALGQSGLAALGTVTQLLYIRQC